MITVAELLIGAFGLWVIWRSLRDGLSSASRIEPASPYRPFGFNPSRGENS